MMYHLGLFKLFLAYIMAGAIGHETVGRSWNTFDPGSSWGTSRVLWEHDADALPRMGWCEDRPQHPVLRESIEKEDICRPR